MKFRHTGLAAIAAVGLLLTACSAQPSGESASAAGDSNAPAGLVDAGAVTACIDPERFKYLEHTNAKTTFTRLYGRAPRGERVREYVPDGRW